MVGYKLPKNDWVTPFFVIFRSVREKSLVTVSFDHPVLHILSWNYIRKYDWIVWSHISGLVILVTSASQQCCCFCHKKSYFYQNSMVLCNGRSAISGIWHIVDEEWSVTPGFTEIFAARNVNWPDLNVNKWLTWIIDTWICTDLATHTSYCWECNIDWTQM